MKPFVYLSSLDMLNKPPVSHYSERLEGLFGILMEDHGNGYCSVAVDPDALGIRRIFISDIPVPDDGIIYVESHICHKVKKNDKKSVEALLLQSWLSIGLMICHSDEEDDLYTQKERNQAKQITDRIAKRLNQFELDTFQIPFILGLNSTHPYFYDDHTVELSEFFLIPSIKQMEQFETFLEGELAHQPLSLFTNKIIQNAPSPLLVMCFFGVIPLKFSKDRNIKLKTFVQQYSSLMAFLFVSNPLFFSAEGFCVEVDVAEDIVKDADLLVNEKSFAEAINNMRIAMQFSKEQAKTLH